MLARISSCAEFKVHSLFIESVKEGLEGKEGQENKCKVFLNPYYCFEKLFIYVVFHPVQSLKFIVYL